MRDSCKQKEQQELTVCGQVGAATHLGLCAAQLQDKHRAGLESNLSPRSGDLGIWGDLVGLGLEWSYASGTWFGWDTWSGGLDSGETIANPGCHLLAGSVQFLSMMACISDCTLDGICEEQIGSRAQDVDPSLSVAREGARQGEVGTLYWGGAWGLVGGTGTWHGCLVTLGKNLGHAGGLGGLKKNWATPSLSL